MKQIELTQGRVAIMDDCDFGALSKRKWTAMRSGGKWYAYRKAQKRTVLMHRVIMKALDGLDVDHANGNGLDNRRVNLRVCSRSQNLANQSAKPSNRSGYKGVSWDRRTGQWIAFISVNRRSHNLGRFDDIQAAHAAYESAAHRYFGKFARTE